MTRHKRKRHRSGKGSPGSTPKTTRKVWNKKGIPIEEETSVDLGISETDMAEQDTSINTTPDGKRHRGDEEEFRYVPALPNIAEVTLPSGFGDLEFTEDMTIIDMFKKLGNLVVTGARHNVDLINAFKRESYKLMDDGFSQCHSRIDQIGIAAKENSDKIHNKLTKHINDLEKWKKDLNVDLGKIKSEAATAASVVAQALGKANDSVDKVKKIESTGKFVSDCFDEVKPELEEMRYVEKMRQFEFEEMKQELSKMKFQQISNNQKSRELNLRIFNMPERRETFKNKAGKMIRKSEDTMEVVLDYLIHRDLIPDTNRSDLADMIKVAHRTGKSKDGVSRQIIIRVKDMKTKMALLINSSKKKKKSKSVQDEDRGAVGGVEEVNGSENKEDEDPVFIVEDLPPEDLEKRNWASDFMKEQRKSGKKAHLKFGKVEVDRQIVNDKDVAAYYQSIERNGLNPQETHLRDWAENYIKAQRANGCIGYIKSGKIYIDSEVVDKKKIETFYLKEKWEAERKKKTPPN